jgi:type VI secretion system protein ImpB
LVRRNEIGDVWQIAIELDSDTERRARHGRATPNIRRLLSLSIPDDASRNVRNNLKLTDRIQRMARESGQKFIRRVRPPRVHITYENPADAEEKVEIPFVMGVMADLSGNAPGEEKPEIVDRKFLEFDMDNLDARMAAIKPGINFRVDNKLSDNSGEKMGVELRFDKMADFDPTAVAKQIPAVARLLEARMQLANLQRYVDGKSVAEEQLRKLLADPQLMQALKNRTVEQSDDSGK